MYPPTGGVSCLWLYAGGRVIGRHTFYNFSFLTEAKCAVDGRVPLDGRSNDAVTRYLSRKNSGRLFVSIPGARLCAKSEARAQRRAQHVRPEAPSCGGFGRFGVA